MNFELRHAPSKRADPCRPSNNGRKRVLEPWTVLDVYELLSVNLGLEMVDYHVTRPARLYQAGTEM